MIRGARPLAVLGLWVAAVFVAGVVALPSAARPEVVHVSGGSPEPSRSATSLTTTSTTTAPLSPTTSLPPPVTSTPKRVATTPVQPPSSTAGADEGIQTAPGMPRGGPASVSGVVRDGAGRPVAGACVDVFGGPMEAATPMTTIRTITDGRYSAVVQLTTESETANVRVHDCTGAVPGFAQALGEVHTFPNQAFEADFVIGPGAVVRGTVVDDAFHEVDGSGLCAVVHGASGDVYGPVSASGVFVVTGVPPSPMASLQIMEGCDYTAGFIPRAVQSLDQIRPGDDIGRIAVIPFGPRSKV